VKSREAASVERRRHNRLAVDLPGTIRAARIGSRAICYGQISQTGCRVTGDVTGLDPGAAVVVTLGPVGDSDATVRWLRGNAVGVEFAEALHPALLAYLAGFVEVVD
jgi:hypothetical protein